MSEVKIRIGKEELFGELFLQEKPKGLVIFVHGSGSGRHSPRNQFVAQKLQSQGLATLLFDLLTLDEEVIDDQSAALRFDIPFLAKRLIAVTEWVKTHHKLPIGYFGASTGAAAALLAASTEPVKAIVSRGGRPDLAKNALEKVSAPTLLIVGGLDSEVLQLNQLAFEKLKCEKKLEIVPGATHLFEERGKLEVVANLASNWFCKAFSK